MHLRLCSNCRRWQREQRATEALLDSLLSHTIPAGVRDAVQEAISAQEKIEKERGPLMDTAITTQKSEGLIEVPKEIGRRNFRIRLVWAAFGILVISLVWLGARALKKPADQIARGPSTPPVVDAVPVLLVLPEDYDDGAPFEGKIIALIEPAEKALLPEVRPIKEALAHMLLSDLASDPGVRVVSRERVSQTLAEVQMGEAALTEPETTQHLGRAIEADTLVSIKVVGDPNKIGVALQLLYPETGELSWSKKFSGSPEDLISLEKEMLAALRKRLELGAPVAKQTVRGRPATLAVFDFQPAGPAAELDKHAGDLADLLSSYLSNNENVRLIERERLAIILEEKELILTQRSATEQAWLASMLGAQRFLYTSMVQWKNQVRFDSHLVQPETGLIIGALSAQGRTERTPALLKELADQIAAKFSASGEIPTAPASISTETVSLEAAIHYARGYRHARKPDYEQAKVELEKAAVLAPHDKEIWWQLVNACYFGRMYDDAARHAKTFAANNPETAGEIKYKLTLIERARRSLARTEAAARAFLNDPNFTEPWKVGAASEQLIFALAVQGRWEAALEFCIGLEGKTDYENLSRAWSWLFGTLSFGAVRGRGGSEPAPGVLELLRRAVEAMPAGEPMIDQRTAHEFSWLLLGHCVGQRIPSYTLYKEEALDLAQGLAIAERAAEKFKDGNRLPAKANIARGLILARMERHEEALATLRSVLENYPNADVDNSDYVSFTSTTNGMVHFYMGLIYEHIGNRAEAASAYRKAVALLDPNLNISAYLINTLEDWKEPLPTEAVREKRVQGYPPFEWGHAGLRLVDWLRSHDYQLWGTHEAYNARFCGGVVGTLVIIHEGEIPEYLKPEDLRAWVVHGGRLLVISRTFGHAIWGRDILPRRFSRDLTLNWLLYPFEIQMEQTATWTSAEANPRRVIPTQHAMAEGMKPFAYEGDWWPLVCPEETAVLRLADVGGGASSSDGKGPVVAAAREMGLGRVAVVSLREWFPCGSYEGWRSPADWEVSLLDDVMGWLTAPEADPERRELAEQLSYVWQTYTEEHPRSAVEDFRAFEKLPGLLGEETKYLVARLNSDEDYGRGGWLGSDLSPFRELYRSAGDPWLRRASAHWLCRLSVEANNPREAEEYHSIVAETQGDKLWAKATIQLGNLWVERGDFKKAEKRFREVAGVIPHSDERIRALFGLAYALEQQRRFGEATRLYEAIEQEYRWVEPPFFYEYTWPDPWHLYWPESERYEDWKGQKAIKPYVRDAVQYRLQEIKEAQTGKGGEKEAPGKKGEGVLRSLSNLLKSLIGDETR